MSLRGVEWGRRGAGPYKEPSWAELWECQLAQPQVTRASLSLPALQQSVLIRPLFVPFEGSWEKWNSPESQEHSFRREKIHFLSPSVPPPQMKHHFAGQWYQTTIFVTD